MSSQTPMNLLEFFKDGYGWKQRKDVSVRRWEFAFALAVLLIYASAIILLDWRSWGIAGRIFYGIATTLAIVCIALMPYIGYRLSIRFRKK